MDRADAITAGRAGQAVIAALAVGLLVTLPRVAPWFRAGDERESSSRSARAFH